MAPPWPGLLAWWRTRLTRTWARSNRNLTAELSRLVVMGGALAPSVNATFSPVSGTGPFGYAVEKESELKTGGRQP